MSDTRMDIDARRDGRITQLVREYIPKGPGLVFVRTKAHARHLAELLQLPYVTSEVSRSERKEIADGLRDGSVQAAVATAAWSTGVNIPALRWLILPERVKAPIATLQGSGRVMRNAEGKEGFEIINLIDGSSESGRRYGAEREQVLVTAGFEVSADEMKLDQLLSASKPSSAPRCESVTPSVFTVVAEETTENASVQEQPREHKFIRAVFRLSMLVLVVSVLQQCLAHCAQ